MWGNLAGRLGANDLNSTLQKIGNAVAPPPGDDDYDDDDYDEEYDDEYDEYEDDEVDDDEGDGEVHGGLGLVGLIARALDDNKEGGLAEVENDFEDGIKGENDASNGSFNVAMSDPTTIESVREDPLRQNTALPKPNADKAEDNTVKYSDSETSKNDGSYLVSGIDFEKVNEDLQIDHHPSKVIEKPPETSVQDTISTPKSAKMAPSPAEKRNEADIAMTSTESTNEAALATIPVPKRSNMPVPRRIIEVNHPTPEPFKSDEKNLPTEKSPAPGQENQNDDDNETNLSIGIIRATTSSGGDENVAGKSIHAMSQKKTQSRQNGSALPPSSGVANAPRSKINDPHSSFTASSREDPEQTSVKPGIVQNKEMNDDLVRENERLLEELEKARNQIAGLQARATQDKKNINSTREELLVSFKEKEARLLQATTEEHHQEMMRIEQARQLEIHSLNEQIAKVRTQLVSQEAKYKTKIEESEMRAERAEADLITSQKTHENQILQYKKREERSIRSSEDKVAHTLALLDERNGQIADLKKLVRDLESKMTKHQEGEEEAEAEADELQDHVDELEHECEELKLRVSQLEAEAEKYDGMKVELTILREERDIERLHNKSAVESAMKSSTKIETERDEAISELRDIKIQLAASIADLEIARADVERITVANSNLSDALEAFQDERRAELELLEEQRAEAEKSLASSHDAAIAALRDAHKREVDKVQDVANSALRHKIDELTALETQVDRLKSENTQMRRSLDEAIYRLQTTQEDVIDRTLMKNILLDWCTMKDKGKRHQVLELMANVLHFNEDERDKVHLTHMDIESVRSRVVGAIAAPLPPSKADVDALEGANVREKFLSFMLAETEEGS